MRTILLVGVMMLVGGQALACKSWEDCIQSSNQCLETLDDGNKLTNIDCANSFTLTAIAYKLDEISKKLDTKENRRTTNVTRR